jgi:hypothetical protein
MDSFPSRLNSDPGQESKSQILVCPLCLPPMGRFLLILEIIYQVWIPQRASCGAMASSLGYHVPPPRASIPINLTFTP